MMKFLLCALLFIACSSAIEARSIVLKAKDSVVAENIASPQGAMQPRRHNAAHYALPRKAPLRYDVSRETGAYFFDTVYKLRMPAAKRINISFNGGYTCYDRYARGIGPGGGSLGVVGGASLMLNPFRQGGGLFPQRGYIRLNAELSSYPYRKGVPGDGPKTPLLDKYTRELTARLYIDARITWRIKRGAIAMRCMMGLKEGTEQAAGTTPLFAGAGISYRLL